MSQISPVTRLAAFLLGAAAIAALVSTVSGRRPDAAAATAQDFCSGSTAIAIAPRMPTRFPFSGAIRGQPLADCLAWQEFVYLNWSGRGGKPLPAPPSQFGRPVTNPNAHETTVWESYDTSEVVFGVTSPKASLTLGGRNEFLNGDVSFDGVSQVGGGWITGQNRWLTFYDVWVDTDEEQYIQRNGLQLATNQWRCATGKVGLQLPIGGDDDVDCAGAKHRYGNAIGAIEVKAAFLDLTGASPSTLAKYLLFQADLCYPLSFPHPRPYRKCVVSPGPYGYNQQGWLKTKATIGLVGLHIVHKLPGAEQMLWATFEHVDNDPDSSELKSGRRYAYYDPQSTAAPVSSPPIPCPSVGCTPWQRPTQIVRFTAIDSDAKGATASFQKALRAALGGKASVFANYELVQVQWPAQSEAVVPAAKAPLTLGGVVPAPPSPVANSVIETYMQQPDAMNDHSCLTCHNSAALAATPAPGLTSATAHHPHLFRIFGAGAPRALGALASPSPQPTGIPFASDYSFLFGDLGH